MKISILAWVFSSLLVACPTEGYAKFPWKKKKVKSEQVKKKTPYEKLFSGKKYETAKGLITLHKIEGRVYFELPLKLLDKDMLLGSTISETTDNRFGSVGEKPYAPLHIVFTKSDSLVSLREVSDEYISADENLRQRISESTQPAILKNFPIKAYSPDSMAVVFDMTDFLLANRDNMNPFSPFSPVMAAYTVSKEFRKEDSSITSVKSFGDNLSIRSSLTYNVTVSRAGVTYIKQMPFTAVLTRSIILLPEQPMRPRYADPRINIFYTPKVEFSNESQRIENVYYALKWRLEPVDEERYRKGELVEPRKPIVFYIDNAFPEFWKKHIRRGILRWNAAFEKIGFKDAVRTEDFPQDDPEFDPDNIKYSCVRYSPSFIANAMGPSWSDPRTGEILNASVYLYHNLVGLVRNWRFVQTAQADSDVRQKVLPTDILGDCISYVVAHEVGHTFAFMHNMAGSSSIPVDSLRSASFTAKYGTTYSIMDYARNNYIAQPGDKEKGVRLTPPELGIYDYFSVKWLYSPIPSAQSSKEEVPVLRQWITEKLANPAYRYGRQQIQSRIDPSSFEEDLGDDPVKASSYGVMNLKYILPRLNGWMTDDPEGEFQQEIYNEIIGQYVRYINNVLFVIGGIYVNEHYEGDPLPSYAPVPREKQREALKFLWEQARDCSWVDEATLQKALPLHSNLSSVVENLIFDYILKRFPAVAICGDKMEKDAYTQVDYMKDIYYYLFTVPEKNAALSASERNMQLKFVSYLVNGIKTVKKGSAAGGASGKMLADERMPLPEGIVAPTYLYDTVCNHFTTPQEVMGFETTASVTVPAEPLEHHCYAMLRTIEKVAKKRMLSGSDGNRSHYRLIAYKISQSLK